MKTLKEVLQEAHEKKVAVGHFNFANLEGFWAIVLAARELNVPVILGTSEGEREFVGPQQAVALVRSAREEFALPIFLNADHTYSKEKVEEAARVGYDTIIFDGAKLPKEENIRQTKECVEIVKSINPDVCVEGELGYIGTSSKLLDAMPEGVGDKAGFTTPEDAKEFVTETGIDFFAPSVGNLHGMFKHAKNPRLDIPRIQEISETVGKPLVLHGGSGIEDEDFVSAIEAGISIVHISTEMRAAFLSALQKSLAEHPDEIAPYRIMKGPRNAIEDVVKRRLSLFNKLTA